MGSISFYYLEKTGPMRTSTAFAFLTLALLSASPAQANLITNGSFEDLDGVFVPTSGLGFETLPSSSTKIPGWTVGGLTGVDWVRDPAAASPGLWEASDGSFSIDLSASSEGFVTSTSFSTIIGLPIVVTFDLSGNPDVGPPVRNMDLLVNGVLESSFSYDTVANGNTRANMQYSQERIVFTPTTTTSTLTFLSLTSSTGGPVLDNVKAVEVPEPTTSALALAALCLAIGRRRSF